MLSLLLYSDLMSKILNCFLHYSYCCGCTTSLPSLEVKYSVGLEEVKIRITSLQHLRREMAMMRNGCEEKTENNYSKRSLICIEWYLPSI